MTLASEQLTEAHRLAQMRIGAGTALLVSAAWELLDIERLDATVEQWVATVTRIVEADRARSAAVAARYLTRHRHDAAGLPQALPAAVVADPFDQIALRTSLLVTGPYRLRTNLARNVAVDIAVDKARASSAGEALRHTLAGGRTTITSAVRSDPDIEGVQRVTAASPCHFCAMLASRGPVYGDESTADFKPHAHCGCQPEPVYDTDAELTPTAARFAGQWREAKTLASSENIRPEVAFRRLVEGRT